MIDTSFSLVETYKSVKIYYKQMHMGADSYCNLYACFVRFPENCYVPEHAIQYMASDVPSVKRYITQHIGVHHFIDFEEYTLIQTKLKQKEMKRTLKSKQNEDTKTNRSAEFQYYGQVLQGLESMAKIGAGNTTPSSQFTEVLDVIRQAHEKVLLIIKTSSNEICDL